jgi:hypothetical protein
VKKYSRRRKIAKFLKLNFSFHKTTPPAMVRMAASSLSQSSQLPSSTKADEGRDGEDRFTVVATIVF